jgi:hypothetical protein
MTITAPHHAPARSYASTLSPAPVGLGERFERTTACDTLAQAVSAAGRGTQAERGSYLVSKCHKVRVRSLMAAA